MGDFGGYEKIHHDLLDRLKSLDLAQAACILDLVRNEAGQVEVPLMGTLYLIDGSGIYKQNGQTAASGHGSVLAGYILHQGRGEPAGDFVSFDSITGMVPARSSYAATSLGARLAAAAEQDPDRFHEVVVGLGGRPGAVAGSGGTSWIIHLLPKIAVQLVFYPGDEEFPASARLLIDRAAVHFLEFEFLAVLATLFVEEVVSGMQSIPA